MDENRLRTLGRTGLKVGRLGVAAFAAVGCIMSPLLDNPAFGGIFKYIQEFQGYISPGILAAFLFGLIFKRAPAAAGVIHTVTSSEISATLSWPTWAAMFSCSRILEITGCMISGRRTGHICDSFLSS